MPERDMLPLGVMGMGAGPGQKFFRHHRRRRRRRPPVDQGPVPGGGGEEPLSGGPSLPSTGRAHAAGGAVERRSGGARAVASRELQLGVRVRVG